MNSTRKPDICNWSKVLSVVLGVVLSSLLTSNLCLASEKTPVAAKNPETEKLEKLVKAHPDDTATRARLGQIYLRQKNYEKAIEHLKEAAAAEPSPSHLTLLADAYRKNKSFLDEIRTLEVLGQRKPNDAGVQELLGRAYDSTNSYDKSAEHYRKAIELDKKRMGAYEGLFSVFTKSNNNYERRSLLGDMQKVFGDSPEVSTKLCRFFSQDNFIEKGIEVCQKAISLDPSIPDNHVFLALNYKGDNEVDQAMKIIQTAGKRFVNSEFTQFTAGTMNDEIKNYETSRFYYRRCIKADPVSDRCWGKLGQSALQLKDYQESLNAFIKACQLNSRGHYTDFRNATTTIRIQKVVAWEEKFQNAVDRCGVSGP